MNKDRFRIAAYIVILVLCAVLLALFVATTPIT